MTINVRIYIYTQLGMHFKNLKKAKLNLVLVPTKLQWTETLKCILTFRTRLNNISHVDGFNKSLNENMGQTDRVYLHIPAAKD